ncbi:MAG: hypothetical protein ACI4OI_08320 [Gemmiger sp.]
MELLCVLASLAVLFLLCAFLTLKCRLHSALAPLTALGLVVLWLTFAGMNDALYYGTWSLLGLCAAGGVAALLPRRGARPQYRALFTPGAALFWCGAAALAVYFFLRQPLATDYDELSLWATAVKVTKVDDRLYSLATLGTPWPVTQNPGLPLLSYFFSFFGAYADWKLYVAYDILAFAVFAAVLGNLKWNRYGVAVPLTAVLWCTPFFLSVYNHTIYLNTTYMTAYGDVPAGLVMGGAVALWLFLRRNLNSGGPLWAVLPVLALAANIKANTFVLALVAAGLVAVDYWLFPKHAEGHHRWADGLWRRTGFALACFAAPMVIYYFWNIRFVGSITARNAAAGGTGDTTVAMSAVVVNGIRILLGQPVEGFFEERRPQFLQAMADMGRQFWTADGKLSMIGQGRNVVLLILLVFAVAVAVAGSRKLRLRITSLAFFSTLCFAGYNLMLALSYGFIFKPFQAAALTDYNRYIESYYIGWFVLALSALSLALQPGTETVPGLLRLTRPRFELAGQAVLLALAGVMLLRQNQMVLPQLSVLGFSDSEFADRRAARAEAELVCGYLAPDDRVFFVSQGDNGSGWFSAVFDFYPILVDYSGTVDAATGVMNGGGGTLGLEELRPEEESARSYYYHAYTADELDAVVRGNGCTVLYLQRIDDIFVQSYASLFTDGLQSAQDGETLLYRVTGQGFAPVEMEGSAG